MVSYLHRFQKERKEHKAIQKELDAANERFKEYERKDVKLREDIKHLSAKQKKLSGKVSKDVARAEVEPQSSLAHRIDSVRGPCADLQSTDCFMMGCQAQPDSYRCLTVIRGPCTSWMSQASALHDC